MRREDAKIAKVVSSRAQRARGTLFVFFASSRLTPGYSGPPGMQDFLLGWGFTASALGLITLVFLIALAQLGRELRHVRDLTDYLGYDLVVAAGDANGSQKPPATLRVDELRDQVNAVRE